MRIFSIPVNKNMMQFVCISWFIVAGIGCNNEPDFFLVGGSVQGLSGTLTLQNKGGNDLDISANGIFNFTTAFEDGSTYDVEVSVHPAGQTCSVTEGTGTIHGAHISNITITCINNPIHSVGGTVTGLRVTGLVLKNKGGDNLSITNNGNFTFETGIPEGLTYNVTIGTQPSSEQQCIVFSGGTGIMASSNITNVSVICTNTTIVVFASDTVPNGNLASHVNPANARGGADQYCADKNASLSPAYACSFIHAFISITDDDEIRDMPTNYNVPINAPLKSSLTHLINIADNWIDLLDGSIDNSLADAGVTNAGSWWSGSNNKTENGAKQYGTLYSDNCNHWTSSSGSYFGIGGGNQDTDPFPTGNISNQCNSSFRNLICLCY